MAFCHRRRAVEIRRPNDRVFCFLFCDFAWILPPIRECGAIGRQKQELNRHRRRDGYLPAGGGRSQRGEVRSAAVFCNACVGPSTLVVVFSKRSFYQCGLRQMRRSGREDEVALAVKCLCHGLTESVCLFAVNCSLLLVDWMQRFRFLGPYPRALRGKGDRSSHRPRDFYVDSHACGQQQQQQQ